MHGARTPTARSEPAPVAAWTTSSSPSSRRIDEASAPSSAGASLDDLVEDGLRVELGREQAAGARELLRERARGALRLEQLAPLERAAGGAGQLARELEIVVGEAALLVEQREHETHLAGRGLDRHGQQRAVPRFDRRRAPALVEALVALEPARREHPARPRPPGAAPRRRPRGPRRAPRRAETAARARPPAPARPARGRRRPRRPRRVPRRRPGRPRRRSRRPRAAGREPTRSGRSRAGSGPGACSARSSRRSGARARPGSRTRRAAPRPPARASPPRGSPLRGRRAPRRPMSSARRRRPRSPHTPRAGSRRAAPGSRRSAPGARA